MSVVLEPVETVGDVRDGIRRFDEEAGSLPEIAKNLLVQTSYWVYDGDSGSFGPSKFVALKDLHLNDYAVAQAGDSVGLRFDGSVTRTVLERTLNAKYLPDAELTAKLRLWADVVIGPGSTTGIDTGKWQFVTLPEDDEAKPVDYVSYWKYATFLQSYESAEDPLVRHSASDQYDRVQPDDIVWIVTIRDSRLFLIARIVVGEVIRYKEAKRRLGGVWEAKYHLIARPGTEEFLSRIDITDCAARLRFRGDVDRLPSAFQQSFRRLRRMEPQTARFFSEIWAANCNIDRAVSEQQRRLEEAGEFAPTDEHDARLKITADIVCRQGQREFRERLLAAYGARCAVTGCDVTDALEAAHIRPYLGTHTNSVANGILLRADVHTLFDLHLLTVDPEDYTVVIDLKLRTGHYGSLHGWKLNLPPRSQDGPSSEALRIHFEECKRAASPHVYPGTL
jgi:hypothetical protein